MRRVIIAITIATTFAIAAGVVAAQQSNRVSNDVPPPWAYGFATPPGAPAPAPAPPAARAAPAVPDPTQHQLAGSKLSFTAAQVRAQCPADWFPEDHPQ